MRTLILILSIALLTIGTTFAQQKQGDMDENKQQMQDSTMRAMMMEHMAQNPEMHKQMMQGNMMDKQGMMNKKSKKGNKR